MPHVGSEIDANFYELIHKMLETPRESVGMNRRADRRLAYRVAHRIARWDGARFPAEGEFVSIQCHDLTRSGFSFLAMAEPDFSALVVEFGAGPNVFYVGAQALQTAPVMCYPSGAMTRITAGNRAAPPATSDAERGQPMFLVGCRFTRRLRKPS